MARHNSSHFDVNICWTRAFGKSPPLGQVKKEYINIDQPNIIKEYNASMGGVDMLDAHLARCKFPIRTRRWYMILFWHFLSVAVINAWLLYQRDCEAQGIPTSKVLKLRKFQGLVAEGLFQVGTVGVGQQLLASPPRHHKNLFEFTRVQMFVSTKSSIGLSRRNIAIIELCARTSKLICSDCENCASCSFVSN